MRQDTYITPGQRYYSARVDRVTSTSTGVAVSSAGHLLTSSNRYASSLSLGRRWTVCLETPTTTTTVHWSRGGIRVLALALGGFDIIVYYASLPIGGHR